MAELRKGLSRMKQQDAIEDDIEDKSLYEEGDNSVVLDFLSSEIRLHARNIEADIVAKIDLAVDDAVKKLFGEVDAAISRFYDLARTDEGTYEFTRLNGFELEEAILTLQRTSYINSDVISSLYGEAYFADKVQSDEFWEAYRNAPSARTKEDKQAYAYSQTKESRYYYYYRYLIWRRINDKFSSLKELQKTLEFFRTRALKDKIF